MEARLAQIQRGELKNAETLARVQSEVDHLAIALAEDCNYFEGCLNFHGRELHVGDGVVRPRF